MKLSTRGRYAVMAMADLANNTVREGGATVPLADIARRQEISLSYLEQLFAKLRRAELVSAVRGPGGGYRLARSAADTRIADIIRAVDEPIKATRCRNESSKGCLAKNGRCLTHDLWDGLSAQIETYLTSVSLDDVIARRVHARETMVAA